MWKLKITFECLWYLKVAGTYLGVITIVYAPPISSHALSRPDNAGLFCSGLCLYSKLPTNSDIYKHSISVCPACPLRFASNIIEHIKPIYSGSFKKIGSFIFGIIGVLFYQIWYFQHLSRSVLSYRSHNLSRIEVVYLLYFTSILSRLVWGLEVWLWQDKLAQVHLPSH